ncbi:Fur family transcriptional regulator [uncultured Brevundimonas sp.]|uniref:Fur family transcriptional regulator n=1 Tax=uncultured Brevundimonas sp. TaxID=213418 RepID=UPI00261FEF69|nr:Fur family transcriptional regulator [uncultured Brevundimonas sp.]
MTVAPCHHEHSGNARGAPEVARILAAVEASCTSQGERMTAPRRRVLELLLAAGEPVKAYDLIARYGANGEAAKPPTVYRALEFLERWGVVHRIASISAYVACSAQDDDVKAHAAAFLICDCCGSTAEVAVPLGDLALDKAALAVGYDISRTTIEGHGKCAHCREAA